MRSKLFFPGLALTVMVALFVWVGGCSDDKSPTSHQGAADDADFLLLQDHLDAYLDTVNVIYNTVFDNIYNLPNDTSKLEVYYAPLDENDTLEYGYANGWHTSYVARYAYQFTDHYRDSVQFRSGAQPLEEADGLDYMHFIRHWDYESMLVDQTHTNLAGYINIVVENLDGDVAVVNGSDEFTVDWNYFSQDSTVNAVFDFNAELSNVTVNQSSADDWKVGCPSGGTVDVTVSVAYSVTVDDVETTMSRDWTAAITIEEGAASVHVESENYYWDYSYDMCTPVP